MNKLRILWMACALPAALWAQPQMKLDKEKNEFGTVLWANPATAVFSFTNTGNAPLQLKEVDASCACTIAEWPHQAIKPGEKGTIKATFDAKALGTFYKEVKVVSNASDKPLYLQMTGRVVAQAMGGESAEGFDVVMGDVRLSKDVIEFDQVSQGTEPVEEITLLNTSRASFEPILMHVPEYLEVSAFPARIPAGRSGRIRIKLNTGKLHDMGLTQTSVYLTRYFGDKVCDENEINISAILLPAFSNLSTIQRAHAPIIQLSGKEVSIPLANKKKGKAKILISNVGQTDLVIDRLQVFSAAVGVSIPKKVIKPGETVKMNITVEKAKLKKAKPRILMITNDPEHAETIIYLKTN